MATELENSRAIAIIGMSCRFPGASNAEEFWHNLAEGIESIQFFSDADLLASGANPKDIQQPNYVKAAGIIPDIDLFAADFFGFNPKEAAAMSPQHRIFLECAWEALENAGYDSARETARIGTYAGMGWDGYLYANIGAKQDLFSNFSSGYQTLLGNDKDFLTTRVSYLLDLKGPSIDVQTACSTSLVAVNLACQSLLSYQCDMALAGGINLSIPQQAGYFYQEGGILSPDGHCRAFDAGAQGTVPGSGVGIVVLKRLDEALADGDRIDAVIRGFAINNDGALKVGYTAPSVEGQAEVIAEALAFAEIDPETIGYVEAHGTGTVLGDPIEVAALNQVYGANTSKKQFCALGSVKSNLGHLDAAAGVAGLMKAVLSLKYGSIPPSLYFDNPNPELNLDKSPFYINRELKEWHEPRMAAVSCFGIGGTNAHVVLESAPVGDGVGETRGRGGGETRGRGDDGCWRFAGNRQTRNLAGTRRGRGGEMEGEEVILVLSAKTECALAKASENIANYLQQNPDRNLADVAYTLQIGRRGFDWRRMVVARNIAEAIAQLPVATSEKVALNPVIFAFPGQGSQYPNMGREIYETESVFRENVDLCANILQPHLGMDLRQILYSEAAEELKETAIAQAAIFTVEYALAQLWISWGIRPSALIGHSIGEYVAACLAGVFSLSEALELVAIRGKLMQAQPLGAMLAVSLPSADLMADMTDEIDLAAVNSPKLCVVSGSKEAIAKLQIDLDAAGIANRWLHTSHAFHSRMMDGAIEKFVDRARQINFKLPQIPLISNVTGTWLTDTQATDPSYWGRHLRQTVRFSEGIAHIASEGQKIWLEVGAGNTLGTFIRQQVSDRYFPSLRHPQDSQSDRRLMLHSLGKLWQAGLEIDWQSFHCQDKRYRLALPTYPFERQRYWIDSRSPVPQSVAEKRDFEEWFYVPVWKQSYLNANKTANNRHSCYLVFLDNCGLGEEIIRHLEELNRDAIAIRLGTGFKQLSDREYVINPAKEEDSDTLIQEIAKSGLVPTAIFHLWGVTSNSQSSVAETQDLGLYALIRLVQALGKHNFYQPLSIAAVSNHLHCITGTEELNPAKATVLGICRTVAKEYPHISCRSIDINLPSDRRALDRSISQLIAEIESESQDLVVAYRDRYRWVEIFESVSLPPVNPDSNKLRRRGVYLITGGLGGIGLTLAEHLAQNYQAKISVISRSQLPERSQWQEYIKQGGSLAEKIQKIQKLEQYGAEVLVINADVADVEQMERAIDLTASKFGKINGVIHAAGIAGGGTIQLKDIEKAKEVLNPKLQGTLVLAKLLDDLDLDFCLLCSSLTSVLGEFGQVDYCGANAFLDVFARSSEQNLISINWDAWQEVGMAVNTKTSGSTNLEQKDNLALEISPSEGSKIFEIVVNSSFHQLLASTQDLKLAIAQSQQLTNGLNLQSPASTPTDASELQPAISNIWCELLGLSKIDPKANFFEIGGHSLLAIQIVSRMRETLGIDITLQQFLNEAQTVEKLTKIATKSQDSEDLALEQIIEEIENLSSAEIEKALAKSPL